MHRTATPALSPLPSPSVAAGSAHASVRLTYRLEEIPAMLGISRRLLDAERAAGRFPAPDLRMGRVPLWSLATLQAWVERRGGRA